VTQTVLFLRRTAFWWLLLPCVRTETQRTELLYFNIFFKK